MDNEIINIAFDPHIRHVAVIKSKAGTVRSNHYHKKGWHWLYVVSGSMIYCERNLDGSDSYSTVIKAGETVWTGPNKVHKTEFPEDTVIISITPNLSIAAQEEDTVKEAF